MPTLTHCRTDLGWTFITVDLFDPAFCCRSVLCRTRCVARALQQHIRPCLLGTVGQVVGICYRCPILFRCTHFPNGGYVYGIVVLTALPI